MIYNKLVRDKIPEVIKEKGGTPITHIATPQEFDQKLREKLQEEVTEFLASNNPEELADILEVVYAISERSGTSTGALEAIRKKKSDERGGFQDGIILERS